MESTAKATTMQDNLRALVIMGVTGCGKSTVAAAICERTAATLIEGDAFHPEENILKMRAGTPLNDDDRQGWLVRLGEELAQAIATGVPAARAPSRGLTSGDFEGLA